MADELQQGSSRKILTIPNLLSAFRLVLAGVFAAVYLHAKTRQDYHIAVGFWCCPASRTAPMERSHGIFT